MTRLENLQPESFFRFDCLVLKLAILLFQVRVTALDAGPRQAVEFSIIVATAIENNGNLEIDDVAFFPD